MREGDTLVVWKLSRLARSLTQIITVKDLEDRQIGLKALTQNIDTGTPESRLFFYMNTAFDQFQREIIVENTRAGLKSAWKNGRIRGKPTLMKDDKVPHGTINAERYRKLSFYIRHNQDARDWKNDFLSPFFSEEHRKP